MPSRSSGSVKVFYPTYDRAQLIERLRAQMPALRARLPVQRAVLFGSWAAGRATAFSDIDVLIVYADPPREDAYKLVREYLRLRGLEPHVYSESEAARLEPALQRMAQGGIDLLDGG
jgi:predicted nucleotidyltransferase